MDALNTKLKHREGKGSSALTVKGVKYYQLPTNLPYLVKRGILSTLCNSKSDVQSSVQQFLFLTQHTPEFLATSTHHFREEIIFINFGPEVLTPACN